MVQFTLNGQNVRSTAHNSTPLLNVLANDLQINGTKFGCGKAQCSACLVMVDGNPIKSCVAPVSSVAGRSVTTLAGMKEGDKPNRLQQAFIDEQAAQCGYCTSGLLISATALLITSLAACGGGGSSRSFGGGGRSFGGGGGHFGGGRR